MTPDDPSVVDPDDTTTAPEELELEPLPITISPLDPTTLLPLPKMIAPLGPELDSPLAITRPPDAPEEEAPE